jgi:hypothetical protein
MWLVAKAMTSFIPASMERANLKVLDALRKGSQVIEEAGGLEAYDRAARSKNESLAVDEILRAMEAAMSPELVEFEA